jgi:hypothetical protein
VKGDAVAVVDGDTDDDTGDLTENRVETGAAGDLGRQVTPIRKRRTTC